VAPRIVSTVLVVGLLAGTAAAFAVTERLKLVRSPIFATRIEFKLFSPVCDCPKEAATLHFRLREPDRLTIVIEDADRNVVRTLLDDERRSGAVSVAWDGRDDAGGIVAEGRYRPRVHLDEARRTILLPNPITVDTTPPEVVRFDVRPLGFSPDRDGRNDKVSALYAVSEPAHALLYVNGKRRVRSRFQRLEDKLDWFGIVSGKPLRAGPVELALAAEDRAGNVSEATRSRLVQVRYVTLRRTSIRVPAGLRFGVRVRSDARRVTWRFAGGRGRAEPGVLVLRAPQQPGRYTLFVEANGHGARARVLVVPRGG
jgi:FlgD Ig-like domain